MAATYTLNNGHKIPVIGLGTWQSKWDTDIEVVKNASLSAIDLGYRHIDTASCYRTEEGVGEAIQQKIQEGVIKREDMFISSKLFNHRHRQEAVVPTLKESLSRLKLDYLDEYMIHWPVSYHPDTVVPDLDPFNCYTKDDPEADLNKTWKGMEECVQLGLTRSIGLSNFNKRQVQDIVDHCQIKPSYIQLEIHLYLQNSRLVDFCRELDIQVVAYSPLGSPGVSAFLEGLASSTNKSILHDKRVENIGKKYNKTITQVALRFQLQRGLVVIPKSNNPDRQKSNIQVFDFELTEEDMKLLKSIDANSRIFSSINYKSSAGYPFDDEF